MIFALTNIWLPHLQIAVYKCFVLATADNNTTSVLLMCHYQPWKKKKIINEGEICHYFAYHTIDNLAENRIIILWNTRMIFSA